MPPTHRALPTASREQRRCALAHRDFFVLGLVRVAMGPEARSGRAEIRVTRESRLQIRPRLGHVEGHEMDNPSRGHKVVLWRIAVIDGPGSASPTRHGLGRR